MGDGRCERTTNQAFIEPDTLLTVHMTVEVLNLEIRRTVENFFAGSCQVSSSKPAVCLLSARIKNRLIGEKLLARPSRHVHQSLQTFFCFVGVGERWFPWGIGLRSRAGG